MILLPQFTASLTLLFMTNTILPIFAAATGWFILKAVIFIALLAFMSRLDIRTGLLPREVSLGGMAIGIIFAIGEIGMTDWPDAFLGIALAYFLLGIPAEFYKWARGREGLGAGDLHLLAMIGAFTGPSGVFFTFVVSAVTALVWGLSTRGRRARAGQDPQRLAYGPHLALGGIFSFFFGTRLAEWLMIYLGS